MVPINPPAIVEQVPPLTGFFQYRKDGKLWAGCMDYGTLVWSCQLVPDGGECIHGTERMRNDVAPVFKIRQRQPKKSRRQ